MNFKSTRFPLRFFVVLFLLALLPLSVIVVNMAGASAPLAVKSAPSTAGDWPMYGHDQSRTNYNADETTISAANVNQLVSRWQVPIASGTPPATTTSSSPSVANGKVYVGSSASSGPNFFSFDAVTGAPAWSKNLGYYNTCFNVGIGASPAISGNVVVAGGGDQPSVAYYGLDATTGAQLWRVPLNAGGSVFAWASPLIANGRTYLGVSSRCDNPSVRGEVRGVDDASGLNPASAYFVNAGQAGGGVWNSPALSPDGSILVAATGEDYNCNPCTYVRSIVTMDPATMNILQSNKQGQDNVDQDFGSTPIIFHDSQNRTLVGAHLKSGGAPADFFTYVLTDVNSGPLWHRTTSLSVGMMDAYDPTFGSGGTLFIFGGSNTLYAVDPANGLQDRWTPVNVGSVTAHANMAVANGLIFLNLGTATMGGLQIRSEVDGSLLRTLIPANPGSANSGVAVSNGFIYWLSGSYLNAWSLPAGSVTPTPTPTNTFTNTPVPTTTPTNTTTRTATNTPVPSATNTSTAVPSLTPTPTATSTPCVPGMAIWPSPNGSSYDNQLTAVAIVSANDVWAVGYYTDGTVGAIQTLVEHWDGTSWSLVASPNGGSSDNYLRGISAVSANDIWAVGYYTGSAASLTLAEHWDGTSWSIATTANPNVFADYFYAVSAVSANDVWAVGGSSDGSVSSTLVEHWNGSAWSTDLSPSPGSSLNMLSGVAAVSANNVWAAGTYSDGVNQTLIEHWNGTAWSVVSSPNGGNSRNSLESVTAISANDVWAVGGSVYYNGTFGMLSALIEHWNGTEWTIVSNPQDNNFSYLYGISAAATNDVWAVGYYSVGSSQLTLVEHWDGTIWSQVTSPNQDDYLAGVAARADSMWAVGYYIASDSHTRTLTEYLTGCDTTPTPTATPSGGTASPTPTACAISFEDVPPGSTFYPYIQCMACRGIINGYPCGGPGEPCNPANDPYFRPGNDVTRGQFAKIASNAAGFVDPPGAQQYEDVLPGSTFYDFIWRLTDRGLVTGYPCGGAGEPCGPNNLPYFRPNASITRGQIAKIDSNAAGYNDTPGAQQYEDVLPGSTFYDFIWRLSDRGLINGYPCGGAGEPCGPNNLPYYRPGANATRGQASKIVSNTFFPACTP